jgi:ATP synthase F1 gamma subunit
MASLKALKIRIGSVKSTQKITKALNMVAASKLRRAQQSATAARPYATRMTEARTKRTSSSSPPVTAASPVRSTRTSFAPHARRRTSWWLRARLSSSTLSAGRAAR